MYSQMAPRKMVPSARRPPIRPSDVPEERWFNWAGGIRATDQNRLIAERGLVRMKRMLAHERVWARRTLAAEGLECARQVREGICALMGPGVHPRNVVLGSSTSLALLPLLVALQREGKAFGGLTDVGSYGPTQLLMSGILREEDLGRDGTRSYRFKTARDGFKDFVRKNLTRRNYGARSDLASLLRTQPNDELLDAFWALPELPVRHWDVEELEHGVRRYGMDPLREDAEDGLEEGMRPLLYMELISGSCPVSWPFHEQVRRELLSYGGALRVLDISHAFGLLEPLPNYPADVYIGSSSKVLAAEPTTGFAILSDQLLGIVGSRFIPSQPPFGPIAFQFDPEIDPSSGTPEGALRAPAWISLPELESFRFALIKALKLGIGGIRNALKERSGKALDLLLPSKGHPDYEGARAGRPTWHRTLRIAGKHDFEPSDDISRMPLPPSNLIFVDIPFHGLLARLSFPRLRPWEYGLLTMEPALSSLIMRKRGAVFKSMEGSGFAVRSLDDDLLYSLMRPLDPYEASGMGLSMMRISFNHEADSDIVGLCEAVMRASYLGNVAALEEAIKVSARGELRLACHALRRRLDKSLF